MLCRPKIHKYQFPDRLGPLDFGVNQRFGGNSGTKNERGTDLETDLNNFPSRRMRLKGGGTENPHRR